MAIYGWFTHQKMVIFHSYVPVYQRVPWNSLTNNLPKRCSRRQVCCRQSRRDLRKLDSRSPSPWTVGSPWLLVPWRGGGVMRQTAVSGCGCLKHGESMEVYNSIQLPILFDGNMMMMMMMKKKKKKQEIWGMHMMFLSDQRELRIEHPWCPESTLGFWPPWRYPWKAKRGNSRGETWVPQVVFCICGCISLYIGYNQKTSPWYTHPEVERIW